MAIRINRVYTRTGDAGETRLVGGASTHKDSLRVEAYGTVDELNAILGLARAANDETTNEKGRSASRELGSILEQVVSCYAGGDGKEGDQQFKKTSSNDSNTGFLVTGRSQRALYDELVGSPVETVHEHQPSEDTGPGKLGMIGRQVEVHLGTGGCIVKIYHSSPATDFVEGEESDGDSCDQHQN